LVPASKIYDGTTGATPSGAAALLAAETAGTGTTADGKPYTVDSVGVTGTATATYNSKDVATATTVTFSGLSLSGTDAGNYTATTPTQAATITPKALSVSGLAASSKVYNALTSATLTGTATVQAAEATGTGTTSDGKPYTVDSVSAAGTAVGTFADRH